VADPNKGMRMAVGEHIKYNGMFSFNFDSVIILLITGRDWKRHGVHLWSHYEELVKFEKKKINPKRVFNGFVDLLSGF
jgi:hypothetical protein